MAVLVGPRRGRRESRFLVRETGEVAPRQLRIFQQFLALLAAGIGCFIGGKCPAAAHIPQQSQGAVRWNDLAGSSLYQPANYAVTGLMLALWLAWTLVFARLNKT